MIIIERTWKESNPSGGGKISKIERGAFDDSDIEGVHKFINAKSYMWTDVEYKYIKL